MLKTITQTEFDNDSNVYLHYLKRIILPKCRLAEMVEFDIYELSLKTIATGNLDHVKQLFELAEISLKRMHNPLDKARIHTVMDPTENTTRNSCSTS